MAGTPLAPNEIAFACGSPVTEQMNVLVSKADKLVAEESIILGSQVVSQVQDLIQIAKSGVAKLTRVELKEMQVSKDLEMWLEKVNAAILMASDVLDECKYHETVAKGKRRWSYLSSLISTLGRPSLNNHLKSMNLMLKDALNKGYRLSERLSNGAPDGRSAAAQATEDRDCSKLESEVVENSQEDGVKTLVHNLLSSENVADVSVITLVGWAETGMTALAQLLYKNADVMFHFDERMWVHAPLDLDPVKLANCTLKALGLMNPITAASTRVEKFVALQKRLKGKPFLLVLVGAFASDLNPTRFPPLKVFLERLGGSRGSKVLMTTAAKPNIESFVYMMKLETSHYCRRLSDEISNADEIGAFVDMCEGNPLYIKLLGSLLFRMRHSRQWSIIHDKLKDPSSGGVAKLCFDYMSSVPLKRCFQYCYFFPRGALISKEELIELWMALGYLDLRNKSGPDMEALGRHYYDVLMRSSFFQPSEDDDIDMQSCKIPDELYGLDFLTESSRDGFKTIVNGDAKDCSRAVHLKLINCHSKALMKDSFSNLRSLRLENTEGLEHILACARGLRVLIIVDASLEELPPSIGKLARLKYLDISRTSIVKLPDTISDLYNLQTLRLHDLNSKEMPKNFEKLLESMMHLYIHKLEDLYEMYELLSKSGQLVYLSSAKASLKVSLDKQGKLNSTQLHKVSNRCTTISIHCLENASKAAAGISKWLSQIPRTETLNLNWSARRENSFDEDVLNKLQPHQSLKRLSLENFKGTTFPPWMMKVGSAQISNLVKMELENCIWCDQLPPMGHLSCLRILRIVGLDSVKTISPGFYGGDGTTFTSVSKAETVHCMWNEKIGGMEWSSIDLFSNDSISLFGNL